MPVKILRGVLWLCLAGSGIWTVIVPFAQTDRRRSESQSKATDELMGRVHDPTYDLIRRLGEELVPYGGAPTCFVLAAGFLLASYSIDGVRTAVEAGRSTPEERRAEIRDALVSAAERRREPAASPQAERKTEQPAPQRQVGEGRV